MEEFVFLLINVVFNAFDEHRHLRNPRITSRVQMTDLIDEDLGYMVFLVALVDVNFDFTRPLLD